MSKKYSLDSAYEQIGYGRMQTLSTWTMAIVRNSGAFPVQVFAYLTFQQKFLCSSDGTGMFGECSTDEICAAKDAGQDISYKVETVDHDFVKQGKPQGLKRTKTGIDLKRTDSTILTEFKGADKAPMHSFALHQMSFKQTYMDKKLNITRPGLDNVKDVTEEDDEEFFYDDNDN